jgi:hypothetical protein
VVLLARYSEAAAKSKWWRLNLEMVSGVEKVNQPGNYPRRNPEMISADPNRTDLEPIGSPDKTAEETWRYLARVFAD